MPKGSSKRQKSSTIDNILQNRTMPKNLRFLEALPKKKVKLSEKA